MKLLVVVVLAFLASAASAQKAEDLGDESAPAVSPEVRIRVSVDPIRLQVATAKEPPRRRSRPKSASAARAGNGGNTINGPLVVINGERAAPASSSSPTPQPAVGVDPLVLGATLEAAQRGKGALAEGVWDTPTSGGGRMFLRFREGRADPDGKFLIPPPAGSAPAVAAGTAAPPATAVGQELPVWLWPALAVLAGLGLLAWLVRRPSQPVPLGAGGAGAPPPAPIVAPPAAAATAPIAPSRLTPNPPAPVGPVGPARPAVTQPPLVPDPPAPGG